MANNQRKTQSKHNKTSIAQMRAGLAVSPAISAGMTIYNIQGRPSDISPIDYGFETLNRVKKLCDNEGKHVPSTIASQLIALDGLFNSLASQAIISSNIEHQAILMKLALKAQKQSMETAVHLRQMILPSIANVHHTTITQAVQVNTSASETVALGDVSKNIFQENKLLGANDEQRLDTRTQTSSGEANSDMEAVATINGPKNDKGKKACCPKRR